MKKITLIALLVFAFTSVASAAPLMDFEKGKVAFDYTFRPSLDCSITANGSFYNGIGTITYDGHTIIPTGSISGSFSHDFDGDANLDLGLTVGIGNKWAIQFRQYNPTGQLFSDSFTGAVDDVPVTANVGIDGKIRHDEYNLLYSFNKNWAGFVGVVRSSAGLRPSLSGSVGGYSVSTTLPELWSEQEDHFQFGVVGSYKIAPKTNFWGLASFASDYRNWEAGLSYDLGKDLQFNVSYRDTKWDNIKAGNITVAYPSGGTAGLLDINADVTVKGWGFGLTYKF